MRMIVAAIDHSRHAHPVFNRAAELAWLTRSDLTVITAIGSDPTRMATIAEEREQAAKSHHDLINKKFQTKNVSVISKKQDEIVYRHDPSGSRIISRILTGNPVDVICSCADEVNADLVVMGNRGLGNVGTLVLGSVSEKVVRKCSRSVLVVKDIVPDSSSWESIGTNQDNKQSVSLG